MENCGNISPVKSTTYASIITLSLHNKLSQYSIKARVSASGQVRGVRSLSQKGKINQKKCYNKQSKSNESTNVKAQDVECFFHVFLIKNAITNESIEAPRLNVKTHSFLTLFSLKKLGR